MGNIMTLVCTCAADNNKTNQNCQTLERWGGADLTTTLGPFQAIITITLLINTFRWQRRDRGMCFSWTCWKMTLFWRPVRLLYQKLCKQLLVVHARCNPCLWRHIYRAFTSDTKPWHWTVVQVCSSAASGTSAVSSGRLLAAQGGTATSCSNFFFFKLDMTKRKELFLKTLANKEVQYYCNEFMSTWHKF